MTADTFRPRDRLRFPRWGQRGTTGASIPAELAFDGVSQVYGRLRAVDGVSLVIRAGELVCLLGHSGCGKTTLLRIAAGVESPAEGRVFLDKREVTGPKLFLPPEERGIGLMFQDYALFPHLSIIDNVKFGLRDLSACDADIAAKRALARVGLEHYALDYPHVLSGGEQQRVALARSIAPRPGVLLMDEPFSNLDRRMRDAIRDETVAILRETGATTIVVTHDPDEAMKIADRIVLMQAGRIVQQGAAEEIYRRPVDISAARFFCDFNEVEGVGRGGRVETPVGLFAAPGLPDGASAIVCIRPQGVRLAGAGFCLPGRLLSRRFLGEVELVQVAVQGLENPLQARVRGPLPAQPGEDVGVDIDPAEVLVFAAGHP
jgi:iron(III) transport system ATP-binding protein